MIYSQQKVIKSKKKSLQKNHSKLPLSQIEFQDQVFYCVGNSTNLKQIILLNCFRTQIKKIIKVQVAIKVNFQLSPKVTKKPFFI